MSNCLCVFLKAPRRGRVKTRLAATIGAGPATELYRAFVLDALDWATRLAGCAHRIDFSPPEDESLCRALLPDGADCGVHVQVDGDLGRRLDASFTAMFEAGHRRCVIMGTDCPTLGPRQVRRAFRALETADVVLGPTLDGGYYLVGLRRPAPELFRDIPWSTERVLALTLRRAAVSHLDVHALETLSDVDSATDLAPLRSELLARWRRGSRPFPLRTFRTLEWNLPRRRGAR